MKIPIYVGKGNELRLKKLKRNKKHQWVRKHFGFERKVIISTTNEKLAFIIETELINVLDTYNPDFKDYSDVRCNWTLGGEGTSGIILTEEQKLYRKMRLIEAMNRPNVLAKLRGPHSQKHCENIKLAAQNRPPMSDEQKRKLSLAHKGKHLSDETRKKLSDRKKGHIGYFKDGKHSDEARSKIKASITRLWTNPEYRAKMMAARTNKKHAET